MINNSDPCDCGHTIFQSPIAFNSDQPDLLLSRSNLPCIKNIVESIYNAEKLEWNVSNLIELNNNELQYRLIKYHFHLPGEHIINSHSYPLEFHLVFEGLNEVLLVIGFVVKLNKRTSRVLRNIIKEKPWHIPKFGNYFTYSGALTTMGAINFNVNWILMDKPLSITKEDLFKLENKSRTTRDIQLRNGRNIAYLSK